MECARVSVPLDWDKPNGKQIELAVIRHLASRPAERIGSMFGTVCKADEPPFP